MYKTIQKLLLLEASDAEGRISFWTFNGSVPPGSRRSFRRRRPAARSWSEWWRSCSNSELQAESFNQRQTTAHGPTKRTRSLLNAEESQHGRWVHAQTHMNGHNHNHAARPRNLQNTILLLSHPPVGPLPSPSLPSHPLAKLPVCF